MTDSGKSFEKQWKESCKHAGFWVHRITDNTYQSKWGMRSLRTPADFFVVTDKETWLVECKAVKGKSLPFDRLEDHQRDALKDFHHWGVGVIAINMYGDRRTFNRVFLLTISQYMAYTKRANRKSLPLKWLEENAVEAVREGILWKLPTSKLKK